MERFGTKDLIFGFIGNRLRRVFRKPDIDWINSYLAIGGETTIPGYMNIHVIDLTKVETIGEGKYPLYGHVDATVDRIKELIYHNEMVFVHCRVGRGRAPLIAICYLMKYQDMSLDGAIRHVRRMRPYIHLTKDQMKFVRYYERKLNE